MRRSHIHISALALALVAGFKGHRILRHRKKSKEERHQTLEVAPLDEAARAAIRMQYEGGNVSSGRRQSSEL